jgi:hypothetical protein
MLEEAQPSKTGHYCSHIPDMCLWIDMNWNTHLNIFFFQWPSIWGYLAHEELKRPQCVAHLA